jgi:predicted methyltransferase
MAAVLLLLAGCNGAEMRTVGDDGASPRSGGAALQAAVDAADRPAEDRKRDVDRKPAEVLQFCGIQPGMNVAEMMAGSGYYTEILSAALGEEGRLYVHNSPFVLQRFAEGPISERLARLDAANITRIDSEPERPGLPGGLDAVLLIRFYHDFYWQEVDRAAFNQAVYEALAPGGIYCVLDHHAEAGSGDRDVQRLHRVDAEMVKSEILSAGFEWDAQSDLLRNPEDDRTWNIFDDDAARRDRTDRFLFRFRKPVGSGGDRAQ